MKVSYTVVVRDEYGNVLYRDKVKGGTLLKNSC